MSVMSWKRWVHFFTPRRQTAHLPRRLRRQTPRLKCEQLEDRLVPSSVPAVDLTTHGAIGAINGAIFRQFDAQPTGSGVINSFVRLQAQGAKTQVEQGFNSDHRAVQFDENTSPVFTRSIHLSDVPVVDIGGIKYRELLLDINQKASQPYLSLDELRIFAGATGDVSGYDTASHQLAGQSALYDLDAGDVDNWIKLDARLNQGSGKGDMLAYIPDRVFAGSGANPCLYLYSKFGLNYTSNAGFEEWAAGQGLLTSATGGISGTVYLNGSPAADLVVFLDANHNGALDSNEVYTTTDGSGAYSFSALATGLGDYSNYYVGVITPNTQTSGTCDVLVALLQSGQQKTNVNFSFMFDTGGGGDTGGTGGGVNS